MSLEKDARTTGASVPRDASVNRSAPQNSDGVAGGAERLRLNTRMGGELAENTQPVPVAPTTSPIRSLGRYRLLSELGRGGMGTVYLAEGTKLQRRVALKLPRFETATAEEMGARFFREAQLAARLDHPNICRVYDVDVIDGQYAMAMEYVEGRTLASYTKAGKSFTPRQAVSIAKTVALAVEAAHLKGLIHRDIKPQNLMLAKPATSRKTAELKVMDFGLAKSSQKGSADITTSGMIVGTPSYMSKEQWSGKDGDLTASSDVYSLGVTLYELLTGKLPHDIEPGSPPTACLVKMMTEPQIPPSHREPSIDATLDAIVMRSISIEPAGRYRTMAEFADDLGAWLKGSPATNDQAISMLAGVTLSGLPTAAVPLAKSLVRSTRSAAPSTEWQKVGRISKWVGISGLTAAVLFGAALMVINNSGSNTRFESDRGLHSARTDSDLTKVDSSPREPSGEATSVTDNAKVKTVENGVAVEDAPFTTSSPRGQTDSSDVSAGPVGIVNGDFEDDMEGWQTEGDSEYFAVFRNTDTGNRAFTTSPGPTNFHRIGRVYQTFTVPENAKRLECLLHGCASDSTYVALRLGDRTVWKQSGPQNQVSHPYGCDIEAYRGERMTFEIVDYNRSFYGYIGVERIRIVPEVETDDPVETQ
jgi:serine/threonine protein kinase